MSRAAIEILAAQTGAGNTSSFWVNPDEEVMIMTSPDLAGSETADVQISHDNGSTWVDYQHNGSAVELTATQNALRLHGPALYRITKDSTAGSTGIFLQR